MRIIFTHHCADKRPCPGGNARSDGFLYGRFAKPFPLEDKRPKNTCVVDIALERRPLIDRLKAF